MSASLKNGTSSKNGIAVKPGKPATRRVHYVLSTHWDREWYRTFQDFRRQLVHLFDRVLADISSGKMKGPFTTDGQAIILDDYLEIRPERRKQVQNYVKSGKLKVGPWYVLPDEWLVSGESMVRNIRLGREMAREYGAPPSQAGWICDLFGHISQLPQIFGGFDIVSCLLWRGIEPRESAHFIWEGADGTRLLSYRFPGNGYCDYDFDVRHVNERNRVFNREQAVADLKGFLQKESSRTTVAPILMFDGGDHLEWEDEHYRTLSEMKSGPDFPYEISFSSLDKYLADAEASSASIRDVVRGELRETGRMPGNQDAQWLIPGVLSSRIWIKQSNAECQTLLCHWAEPFASLTSSFLGIDYPKGYLDVAWKWLLQNHPHDSICGCSIDQVHEDMKYRFAQCQQIASAQTDESLNALTASVAGEVGEKEVRVLVANPLAGPLDEPFNLTLRLPAEWGTYVEFFGFEPKPAFRIFNDQGTEVPYQLVAMDLARLKTQIHPTKFPAPVKVNDVTVAIRIPLPALGYTTLTVREPEKLNKDGLIHPTRHPHTPGLATSERSMENEILEVTIESNGSLTIRDKRTDQVYTRLLTFEDVADIGDGWFHGPSVNDRKCVSTGASANVSLVSDGKLFCQFRIRTEMRLPEEFDFARKVRSEALGSITLDSTIILRAGCDRVEVRTTVDNQCKDHRLRVLFPSGAKADTFLADSAFDVVERPVALPADNHLARELAVDATPQQSWTAVLAGNRGLAVIARGLPESAVYDLAERPVALTLFRATRRTVFTDGEPLGQLPGKLTFDYWIVPLAGKADRRHLCDYGIQIAAGLKTAQMSRAELALYPRPGQGEVPATASFLEVTGNAVTTSVRRVGDAMEIRLFNPEMKKADASIDFSKWPRKTGKPFQQVTPVNLESKPLEKPQKISGKHRLSLKPKEIVTLRFT